MLIIAEIAKKRDYFVKRSIIIRIILIGSLFKIFYSRPVIKSINNSLKGRDRIGSDSSFL